MKINILSLFPEYFESPLQTSILGKAEERSNVEINIINIRDFATDKHKVTDDRPYGGGAGMVMKVDVIDKALASVGAGSENKKRDPKKHRVILTSAKGRVFNQQRALSYLGYEVLTIICGHYEGVDERVAENLVDEELRIGDYVLTGGEAASMVMVEAIVRLLPGVLGNENSHQDESHSQPGVMGVPQYTRPDSYKGWSVPEVLKTGNHAQINDWRNRQRQQAQIRREPGSGQVSK